MILQFKTLHLHNFGSYADATLDLIDKGFCLVTGKNNFKKDRSLSNGSGKSMVWSALCFTLTGEAINGVKTGFKNQMVPEDDCWTSVEFRADNDNYVITRVHKPKSDLKIIRNDVDVSGKGIRESEQKLAELLPDLSKDLIASTIIIGQGMPSKFSSFSPSGRKELLEKLTKSDFMIEDVKNRLTARMLTVNAQLADCVASINLLNGQLSSETAQYNAVLKDLDSMVKPDYAELIAAANEKIAGAQLALTEANNNSVVHETAIETLNNKLIKANNEKSESFVTLNENYTKAVAEVTGNKLELEYELKALRSEISRLKSIKDVCPTCGQKLQGVEKPDTTAQETRATEIVNLLADIDKQKTACDNKKNQYIKEINDNFAAELDGLTKQISAHRDALNEIKHTTIVFNQTITSESATVAKLTTERDTFDTKYNNLLKVKQNCETTINTLNNNITLTTANKTDLEAHIAVLKKMDTLVKRDFRGYLLTDIINYINSKAKEYCQIVFETTDLDICLNGNALDISYCGKSFDNLSGGEKQRVDLILQFAIRDLLQTYLNYSSNIIVLDEIFDNLDKVATDRILLLITTKLKDIESLFIISHHADELEIPMDAEITIIKNENGISEVL